MSLGAFAMVAAPERELGTVDTIDNIAALGRQRPRLGVSMCAFMLRFDGVPLSSCFVWKFYVCSAAYRNGWNWLVVVRLAATAHSLYYYLGVVRAIYMRPSLPAVGLVAGGGSP